MNLDRLKIRESAPEKGYMLAYFQKQVRFERYDDVCSLKSLDEEQEKTGKLLEIHLFDNKKEYRAVLSCSKRYQEGYVEHVADFEECEYATIKECILLENGDRLIVLNHITYDASGMAVIDDFRLVGKE